MPVRLNKLDSVFRVDSVGERLTFPRFPPGNNSTREVSKTHEPWLLREKQRAIKSDVQSTSANRKMTSDRERGGGGGEK